MRDLTVGKESKVIIQFTLPMLLGNVFQQFLNIIDSIIVGRFIGKEALAAVGASFPIIFTLISLVIGFSIGATIIIAQYFGAKEYDNVKKSIDTLFIVLFFASIIISTIGLYASEYVFRFMSLPDDIIPLAKTYLNTYLYGFIFFFGFNGISAILRGLGDSKTPLYFMIIVTILNIVLEVFFIVVLHSGIAGAAWAEIISQGAVFIAGVFYLNKKSNIIKLSFSKISFEKEMFLKSLKIGLPTGLQQTFVALGMIALFGIVNHFGTDTIAAYSIAMRIDSFASLPAMNFATALSTFVGQNIGAGKIERVRNGLIATLKITSIFSIAVTLIVVLFGTQLMSMFTTDRNVIEIGHHYLVIVCSFYVVFSTMFALNAVMRGAGDTLIPMFITLFSLWLIRIPIAYILSDFMGPAGIWWSIPIGWFAGMTFSWIYYKMHRWKTKSVVKRL